MLVGNKTDLHMERMIPAEEGKKLAENWKAVFLETSAKQNAVSYHPSEFLHVFVSFIQFQAHPLNLVRARKKINILQEPKVNSHFYTYSALIY